MKLREAQIMRLAELVLERLTASGLITIKVERGMILERIRKALAAEVKKEEDLEREAERLLEQSLRSMGGGAGIDRHRMLKMIKERLAKEKGIVI